MCIAAGSKGLNWSEAMAAFEGLSRPTAANSLSRLSIQGLLFSAGSRRDVRYFATKADADAWNAENSAAVIRARRRAREKIARAEAAAAKALLKLPKTRPGRVPAWTAEQYAVLDANYAEHGPKHVAQMLGMRTDKVQRAASARGLSYSGNPGVKKGQVKKPPKPKYKPVPLVLPSAKPATRAPSGPAYLGSPTDDVFALPRSPNFRYTPAKPMPSPARTSTFEDYV